MFDGAETRMQEGDGMGNQDEQAGTGSAAPGTTGGAPSSSVAGFAPESRVLDPVHVCAFDLDGTLLDGQSGSLILVYLIKRHLVGAGAFCRAAWWGVRYKLHLPHRQSEVREILIGKIKHLPTSAIEALMRDFHDEVMIPHYRADGIAELRRRKREGEFVIIVSATFDAVAQASKEYLGADAALATLMETDERGHYTGQVKGEVTAGSEKVRRIEEYADGRFGRGGWILCRAYGDHYTDAPLLESADACYVVNPGPTMRREAARRGWPELEWN